MYGMRRDELRLVPNDPEWNENFAAEKRRIVKFLGDTPAQIEHIGSTAIESVHAKPILDIAILSNDSDLAKIVKALVGLEYEYRGPYDNEADHYYAVRDNGPIRYCQMHIYTKDTPDWESKLRFRDVLRRDQRLAKEYDAYKLSLAASVSDKMLYAEIKHKWVNGFMSKVLASAARD